MGYFLQTVGKLDEAEPYVREAMESCLRVYGKDYPASLRTTLNMGVLKQAQGKLTEAEPFYLEALEGSRKLLGDDHPNTIEAINSLAYLYSDEEKFDKSEELCREVLQRREHVLGPNHPDTLVSLSNLGLVLRKKGDLAEAETYSTKALTLSRELRGDKHPDTLQALNHMGTLKTAQGKYEDAERYLREALDALNSDPGDHLAAMHGFVLINLASLMQSQKKYDAAEPFYRDALDHRKNAFGPNHPDTLSAADNFGGMYMEWGKPEKAEPLFRTALAGYEQSVGKDDLHVGIERHNLGYALTKLKRYSDAESELLAADRIYSISQGVPAARQERLCLRLAELYEDWDKAEPGKGYGGKAEPWRAKLPKSAAAPDGAPAAPPAAASKPAAVAPAGAAPRRRRRPDRPQTRHYLKPRRRRRPPARPRCVPRPRPFDRPENRVRLPMQSRLESRRGLWGGRRSKIIGGFAWPTGHFYLDGDGWFSENAILRSKLLLTTHRTEPVDETATRRWAILCVVILEMATSVHM